MFVELLTEKAKMAKAGRIYLDARSEKKDMNPLSHSKEFKFERSSKYGR